MNSRAKAVAAVLIATLATTALTSCSLLGSDDAARTFGLSSQGPDSGVDDAVVTSQALGRHLDVINFFEAWAWNEPLDVDALQRIHDAGSMPAVTWEPWNPQSATTSDEFAPSRIAAGEFDDYITHWATAAASFDQPMQIRFGHEMNGTWYPWAVGVGDNTAADYIAAYRHVHDVFLAAGATKVQWVWSVDASSRRPDGLTAAVSSYPGDAYVDLVGIDGYNGGAAGDFWQSPEDLFGRILASVASVASAKPVWIYETGSGDELGDKAQWVTDLFAYLRSTPVSGLLWFNFAKPGEANWLIDTDPAVRQAATDALANW